MNIFFKMVFALIFVLLPSLGWAEDCPEGTQASCVPAPELTPQVNGERIRTLSKQLGRLRRQLRAARTSGAENVAELQKQVSALEVAWAASVQDHCSKVGEKTPGIYESCLKNQDTTLNQLRALMGSGFGGEGDAPNHQQNHPLSWVGEVRINDYGNSNTGDKGNQVIIKGRKNPIPVPRGRYVDPDYNEVPFAAEPNWGLRGGLLVGGGFAAGALLGLTEGASATSSTNGPEATADAGSMEKTALRWGVYGALAGAAITGLWYVFSDEPAPRHQASVAPTPGGGAMVFFGGSY